MTQMGISWCQYYHVKFIVSYLECFMKYYFLCRTSKRIFLVKYYFGFGAHYVLVSFRNQMCGLSIGWRTTGADWISYNASCGWNRCFKYHLTQSLIPLGGIHSNIIIDFTFDLPKTKIKNLNLSLTFQTHLYLLLHSTAGS